MAFQFYAFEVKSIQAYVFSGGKLRDIIGASRIVDGLCAPEGVLDKVLHAVWSEGGFPGTFIRRSGGVFSFYVPEEGKDCILRFRALWRMFVNSTYPELEIVDCVVSGENLNQIIRTSFYELAEKRNRPSLSLIGHTPVTMTTPRTGNPAVRIENDEAIDYSQLVKRSQNESPLFGGEFHWPNSFDEDPTIKQEKLFPLKGEDRRVGLIHADGNSLGLILQALQSKHENDGLAYAEALYRFSSTLEAITRDAVETANEFLSQHAENKVMPGRPILAGGDDLTAIVRADLCLEYTRIFLDRFETLARENKEKLGGENVPDLTACAGVVIVNANHPFLKACNLAESLCQHAKRKAKSKRVGQTQAVPSCISFHQVTTSDYDTYQDIISKELSTAEDRTLTCNPYFLNEAPKVQSLYDLVSCLNEDGFSRGPLRGLLDLLYHSESKADTAFRNWSDEVQRNDEGSLDNFTKPLFEILDIENKPDKGIDSLFHKGNTPLHDALVLKSLDPVQAMAGGE